MHTGQGTVRLRSISSPASIAPLSTSLEKVNQGCPAVLQTQTHHIPESMLIPLGILWMLSSLRNSSVQIRGLWCKRELSLTGVCVWTHGHWLAELLKEAAGSFGHNSWVVNVGPEGQDLRVLAQLHFQSQVSTSHLLLSNVRAMSCHRWSPSGHGFPQHERL